MTTEHDTPEGRGPGSTLGQAARAFFTFHSPRSFAVLWPLLVAARISLGGFTWAVGAVERRLLGPGGPPAEPGPPSSPEPSHAT